MNVIQKVLRAYAALQGLLGTWVLEETMKTYGEEVVVSAVKYNYNKMNASLTIHHGVGTEFPIETLILRFPQELIEKIRVILMSVLHEPNELLVEEGTTDKLPPIKKRKPIHSGKASAAPADGGEYTPYDSEEYIDKQDDPKANVLKLVNKVPVRVKFKNARWSQAGNLCLFVEVQDGVLEGKTLIKTLMSDLSKSKTTRLMAISQAFALFGFLPILSDELNDTELGVISVEQGLLSFYQYLLEISPTHPVYLIPSTYKDGFWLNWSAEDAINEYELADEDVEDLVTPDWFDLVSKRGKK